MTFTNGVGTVTGTTTSTFPRVFTTADGQYAVGAVSLDLEHDAVLNQVAEIVDYQADQYLAGDASNQNVKWNSSFEIANPLAATYTFETFIVVGTPEEVRVRLGTLYAQYSTQFLALSANKMGFDPTFYASTYPSVAAANTTTTALINHFLTAGISEGLCGVANFRATTYVNKYSSIATAFAIPSGEDYLGAFEQYFETGIDACRPQLP